MIVCQHESNGSKDTKFTVIFEDDEISILESKIKSSEDRFNLEEVLAHIILGITSQA